MSTVTSHLPQPLLNPPLALLGDERTQMSFGERAALEGVLADLWPKLSVEVGSAAGGSLARIAEYSEEVHSFDLVPPDESVSSVNRHLCLHTGDSRFLLPEWLGVWDLGRNIDFVLVDGDHTPEGVKADLMALLAAAGTRRTVILLHDAGNPHVREGIEAVMLDEHPKVVYHELDFVPGRLFAKGPFSGERWGGFALIVTGDRATDGYRGSPAQTLYRAA